MSALSDGLKGIGQSLDEDVDIRFPFYGDLLDELVRERDGGIARGVVAAMTPVERLELGMLLEAARSAGVTDEEVAAQLPPDAVIERGIENLAWVQATLKALSERSPGVAELAIRWQTKDVAAYLLRPTVRERIDAIVSGQIDGRCIVIAHSLGSVVAHQILSNLPDGRAEVPLFLTLGSPLGLSAIRTHLKRQPPLRVGRWVNACDPQDLVALVERLERPQFDDEIENITDVNNPRENKHGIAGYLRDPKVCRRIADALGRSA